MGEKNRVMFKSAAETEAESIRRRATASSDLSGLWTTVYRFVRVKENRMLKLRILCVALILLCAMSGVSQTHLIHSNISATQENAARKAWPVFYSEFKAAVRKRDRAYLRRIMPSTFDCYGLAPCDDLNSKGAYAKRDKRNLVFLELDKRNSEGWRMIENLLSYNHRSDISDPTNVTLLTPNGDCGDHLLRFEFRTGHWYFAMFGTSECE